MIKCTHFLRTVEVASSKVMGMSPSGCTSWSYSQLVADLIESVVEISKLKMSAEFVSGLTLVLFVMKCTCNLKKKDAHPEG